MSSIYGIFNRNDRPVERKKLEDMKDALAHWEADYSGMLVEGNAGMGCLMLHNTPEAINEKFPFHDAAKSLSITADACLYNRDELFEKLGVPYAKQKGMTDGSLILLAYEKWGEDCPGHLLGDFAFAIWDEREKKLFCARDQMGMRPFFYYAGDKTFVFASENRGLLALPEIPPHPDFLWMADYICGIHLDKESTFHKEILRLPPAHTLTVTSSGLQKKRYWDFDRRRETIFQKEEDYFDAFRELLENAVRVRLRTHRNVGSELTGGLDSSAVSSLADRFLKKEGKRIYTFSHASPEDTAWKAGFLPDERLFIDMIIDYTAFNNHNYVYNRHNKGLYEMQERAFNMQSGIPKSDFATCGLPLFEEATEKGVGVLLSGLGGDNIPSSHGPGFYRELADRGQWKKIFNELQAVKKRKGGSLLKSIIATYLDVRAPWLKKALMSDGGNQRRERLENSIRKCREMGVAGLDELLRNVDMRTRAEHQKNLLEKARTVREKEYLNISNAHVTTRVECSSVSTGAMKMEYRYPLLDIPLLEFSLAIPASMKRKNSWGRYVYRKSVEGLVPQGVQWGENKFGHLFPWWYNSLFLEKGRPISRPSDNAPEEVKFYYRAFKSTTEEAIKVYERQKLLWKKREISKGACNGSQ